MTAGQLAEMHAIINNVLDREEASGAIQLQVQEIAAALGAAGFVKTDRIEYAADHEYAAFDVVDEDGDLWENRSAFEEYYKGYGSATMMQRSVGPWVPLEPAA